MLQREFDKKRMKRFKGFYQGDLEEVEMELATLDNGQMNPVVVSNLNSTQAVTSSDNLMTSLQDEQVQNVTVPNIVSSSIPICLPQKNEVKVPLRTNVRYLKYDDKFVTQLRKISKSHGTTIAAVLIVNALASVRTAFTPIALKTNKKLPSRQAWVVTNSMRHLLPNSSLLSGSDKQTDPSISIFGGY